MAIQVHTMYTLTLQRVWMILWTFCFIILDETSSQGVSRPGSRNGQLTRQGRPLCRRGWELSPLIRRCVQRPLNCNQLRCQQGCEVINGGTYRCKCLSGFELNRDGRTCNDLDECRSNPSACDHGCQNTFGSFMCTCRHGYRLADDGRTCKPFSDYSDSLCAKGAKMRNCQNKRVQRPNTEEPAPPTNRGPPHSEDTQQEKPDALNSGNIDIMHQIRNLITMRTLREKLKTGQEADGFGPCIGDNCDYESGQFLTDCIGSGCAAYKASKISPESSRIEQRATTPVMSRQTDNAGREPIPSLTTSHTTMSELASKRRILDVIRTASGSRRKSVQNDQPRCRDDLCNDPERAESLLVTAEPNDFFGKSEIRCPVGYRIVDKSGIKFCQTVEVIEVTGSVSEPEVARRCADGERLIRNNNGQQECITLGTERPNTKCDCPSGRFRQGENGVAVCEEGHDAGGRANNKVCPPGQVAVAGSSTDDVVCRDMPFTQKKIPSVDCGVGKIAVETSPGVLECVEAITDLGMCPPGTVAQANKNGAECVAMLQCGHGLVLRKTNTGMSCQPQPTDSPCPSGLQPVETSVGIVCEYVPPDDVLKNTKKPCFKGRGQVINGVRTCVPDMADKGACPEGRVPIQTDKGTICGFETKSMPHEPQVPQCNKDEQLFMGACMPIRMKLPCLPGQTFIGGRCIPMATTMCQKGEDFIKGQCVRSQEIVECPPGTEFIMSQCATYVDKTCPPGEEQLMTDQGDVICHPVEGAPSPSSSDQFCADGEILYQTRRGFECVQDTTSVHMQICPGSLVRVVLDSGHGCLHYDEVDVLCEDWEVMVRQQTGFTCRPFDPSVDTIPCTDGSCRINSKIPEPQVPVQQCEEGYEPVTIDGRMICRRKSLVIECPHGFVISLMNPTPTCVREEDQGMDCINEHGSPGPCLSGGGSPGPVECGAGFVPTPDSMGTKCVPVSEMGGCDDLTNCANSEKQSGCDDVQSEGEIRPCDIDAEQLLAGCHPQCANGGTCNTDNTCDCPIGIIGSGCQEDVDECSNLRQGYCEYSCINTFGSFHCACPDGFVLENDGKTCTRIGCFPECMNGGECFNDVCSCSSGFTGSSCEQDVDECDLYGSRLCQHHCRNTYGSYGCICPPGTRLNADMRTCTNTTCIPVCRNGGDCVNHVCVCPPGYRGIICQLDINECYTKNPCSHHCINTRGSYQCACPDAYQLHEDRRTCVQVT